MAKIISKLTVAQSSMKIKNNSRTNNFHSFESFLSVLTMILVSFGGICKETSIGITVLTSV